MVNFDAVIDKESFFYASNQILVEHLTLDEVTPIKEDEEWVTVLDEYPDQGGFYLDINPGQYIISDAARNSYNKNIRTFDGILEIFAGDNMSKRSADVWTIEKDERQQAFYIINDDNDGCRLGYSNSRIH